ncbi:MAG: ABC transporter permease, partial [Lachnospiraceae bacterium]|nr:ABC transporter permease [Lachnospiraceae bacterium]
MLSFVFRRIESRKWMVISLLIGNLLMIAIAAASPMYSRAILQRTLTRNLSDYYVEKNKYPGLIVLRGSYSTVLGRKKEADFDKVIRAGQMMEELQAELDVPALYSVTQLYINNVKALHELAVENRKNELTLRIASYSDQEEHLRIVNGEMYSGELDDHTFDVIVSERTFVEQSLLLGEELELTRLTDASGTPYRIRIAGIFENSMEQDVYWVSWPTAWRDVCLMDQELFEELFANEERMDQSFDKEWYLALDYARMRGDQAERYLGVLDRYGEAFEEIGFKGYTAYFRTVLEDFVLQSQKLNTTILILQTPVFILLAVFIFMVSRQILEMEQNEIAVYKSRGADRKQIVFIYLLQSLVISILGLAGGIPLGVLMCRLLGASNSFLEFVQRAALSVETEPKVWLFAGAAALFSACTMVLPVIRYANVNIVAHKRGKNRKAKSPLWQRLFVDVILLGVSLYGLYQYYEQREYLVQKVLAGASLDPLLYFCSSLFMVGSALLVFRIFPLLIRLLFLIGKRWWPPSLYVSFLRILRTRNNQGFFMVFLILTLAMGIFNAQAARTINANAEDKIRYSAGADLVLQEVWKDNSAMLADNALGGGAAGQSELVYEEPDFGKYQTLEGIESVTKVFVDKKVNVSVEGGR